ACACCSSATRPTTTACNRPLPPRASNTSSSRSKLGRQASAGGAGRAPGLPPTAGAAASAARRWPAATSSLYVAENQRALHQLRRLPTGLSQLGDFAG